jgi:hypothetical protein
MWQITTVGFWNWLLGRPAPTAPASPYSSGSDLVQLTVQELYGDADPQLITQDIAARVPGLKRALAAHCGLVAQIPFRQYDFETLIEKQPPWLTNSASGLSPYLRMFGVTADLFWYGWALIGAEVGPDGYPVDAMHIPQGYWWVDQRGGIGVDEQKVPARYRDRLIAIPLGLNGVLVDGIDTIRSARWLEQAWQKRAENPIAQTELHLTDDTSMSRKEKLKMARDYDEARRLYSTSVTPHNLQVIQHGVAAADLFESGRNAVRLDLANHALVPASLIEGAKNGSAGEINYSNETSKRNELYDFGTGLFVNAIAARLSMDDVCPPGQSIRPDLSTLMQVPTPTTVPALED